MLIAATSSVVAQSATLSNQKSRNGEQQSVTYDPIDYSAVKSILDKASQKTFLQRVAEALVRPMAQPQQPWGLDMNASFGLAYTQQTNVALAALVIGSYALHKGDRVAQKSSFSLGGLVSVNGFFRLALSGENWFLSGNDVVAYSLSGGVMPTYFWGLGYAAADVNPRSKYTRCDATGKLAYKRRLVGGLWAGAELDARYGKAYAFEEQAMQYVAARGDVGSAYSVGVGLTIEFDSRDDSFNPSKGVHLTALGEFRPKGFGNLSTSVWHLQGGFNLYQSLWQGAVVALDMYADMYSSAAPWLFWPVAGGESRMRGYYLGRYTDSKMASAQVELRQRVYGSFGVCVWGGRRHFSPR